MAKIIEIKQLNSPTLYLTWIINNICTNKCSYCPSNLHAGTNHNYEWSDALQFANLLIKKYPKIHLSMSGGEPTLSPWFQDIVKIFSKAGHSVGVTTNGARTVSYYEDISQFLSYAVISHHPSFADDKLIEKALACAKNTPTTVTIMFDSRYFNKCLELYYKIKNEYPELGIMPVKVIHWEGVEIEDIVGKEYTDEQLTILDTLPYISTPWLTTYKVHPPVGALFAFDDGTEHRLQAQPLINAHDTNFRGWECNMGFESLLVYFDGSIKLANCDTSPIIGTIQDLEKVNWPTSKLTCLQDRCICTTDVYVSKRKLNR